MKLRNIDRKARLQNVMLFYTGIVFYILMALENHYKYFNFNWLEIAFVIHSFIFTFVNIYSFYYELPTERKDSIYKIREYVDENLELITFYDQKVFGIKCFNFIVKMMSIYLFAFSFWLNGSFYIAFFAGLTLIASLFLLLRTATSLVFYYRCS